MTVREIYLTKEQCHRIGALACDALYGMQIGTTNQQETPAVVSMTDVDDPSRIRIFEVEADGACKEVT